MGEIVRGPRTRSVIATWLVPPALFAAAMVVGELSIRLAPGEIPGSRSLFSTPVLDLILFGLVPVACVACFLWPRSALLTATSMIGALWYYSQLYIDRSTDPLGGLVYLLTFPLAIACVVCGLVGFFNERSKRLHEARARRSGGPAGG